MQMESLYFNRKKGILKPKSRKICPFAGEKEGNRTKINRNLRYFFKLREKFIREGHFFIFVLAKKKFL